MRLRRAQSAAWDDRQTDDKEVVSWDDPLMNHTEAVSRKFHTPHLSLPYFRSQQKLFRTEIAVKPQTSKSPRQTRRLAWHIAPIQFAILETEEERCKGAPLAAFRLSQKRNDERNTKNIRRATSCS